MRMKLISPRRKGIMSVIEHLCYTMCPREGNKACKKHHWINDDIVIDFPLPQSMLYLIEELEKLDAEEDYAYFNYAEALDTGAKELYRRGTLTRKQWDQLCLKYDGVYE